MDPLTEIHIVAAFTLWLLLLLLHSDDDRILPAPAQHVEEEDQVLQLLSDMERRPAIDMNGFLNMTFMNFRICAAMNVFHDELEYWVKPRSTTWFSQFLLQQYDNSRWISMFRMTKPAVFALAEVIRPHVEKCDTKYRLAVPVLVRVACTLFKLTHGANFTICSEVFAIGRSTVSKILREVVHAINECLQQEISWPVGDRSMEVQQKFYELCSLPAVAGVIDGTHFSISKPRTAPADYYYFKTGGYSMQCQAVVDSGKRFLDVCVGMPGSTNDSRVLRRSSLFQLASTENLFRCSRTFYGFSPYLLGDLGYPLLPWLIIPHRDGPHLSVSERLLNKKLRKGRAVVENAFGILKQTFRELSGKSEMHITFFPDVVLCCMILHNILLRQSHEEVAEFLRILQEEGYQSEEEEEPAMSSSSISIDIENRQSTPGHAKRSQLGMFLSTRRP